METFTSTLISSPTLIEESPFSKECWQVKTTCPQCKCVLEYKQEHLLLLPQFMNKTYRKVKGARRFVKCPSSVCQQKNGLIEITEDRSQFNPGNLVDNIVGRRFDKEIQMWINQYEKDMCLVSYDRSQVVCNIGRYMFDNTDIEKYLTEEDKIEIDNRTSACIIL